MKKQRTKQILSIFLCFVMLFSLTIPAMAAEDDTCTLYIDISQVVDSTKEVSGVYLWIQNDTETILANETMNHEHGTVYSYSVPNSYTSGNIQFWYTDNESSLNYCFDFDSSGNNLYTISGESEGTWGIYSECSHESYTDSKCDGCGADCLHENVTDGKCDVCGAEGKFITIIMNDSYGDGWNGNAIQIGTISGDEFTKIAAATFDDGASATYKTVISDESSYAFRWTVGSYPDECSFSIVIGGETVFETSDCRSYADDDYIYIWCNHSFSDSICSVCGLECGVDFAHTIDSDGKCTVCGLICNHSYTNHYCKACGTAENGYYVGACGADKVNDAIWSLDSEGTLTISGTGKYAVEWLDAPWFAYKDSIKNIIIEEGITNIADTSFADLTNAVSLSIPSTVNEIDNYNNNYFAEIRLAEENISFALIDGVLFNADKTELIMYPAKKADETYTVPAGVTTLCDYSFWAAENLKTINISDDVTSIGSGCFQSSSLETVNFGANVESIKRLAFDDISLKTVVLPEKLTEIPYGLFYSCDYLESLVIGSNVTSIDESVIIYCDALETLHFTGTAEQWEAITKPADTTDAINTIAVHCGAFEEKAGFAATCEADGHTAGLYCAECDDYISGEVIPATDECVDENSDKICEICNNPVGAPNIYVGGIFMNGDNYTDILGDADEGATAYYIPETNTLVLDGFVYEGEGYGIECDGSLNIEIKGENKIVAINGLDFVTSNDAVINIVGTGKLDIETTNDGIYAESVNDANIEINVKDSVTLNVNSESDGVDIDSNNDIKLTVSENGALNIKAVSEGITISYYSESVEILVKDNGTLTIDGEDECIYIYEAANAAVTFTDNAKVSLTNTDEEGIYIYTYDSGTVTVSGNADVYIDVDEEGIQADTLIVNGGSLKAYSSSGYQGINAVNVTVNGGKLIAKGKDNYAIEADSIKLTDGTLIASNNTAEYPVFSVTPDFSEYTADHTILASENADGSGLAEYDSANTENYRIITIQCKHEFDEKVCTKCGFECGIDCAHYLEDCICLMCGSYVYAITHQPTATEPYVELNDNTDASYQWYELYKDTKAVTSENASAYTNETENYGDNVYNAPASSFNAEDGTWTPIYYIWTDDISDVFSLGYFVITLRKGDTLEFDLETTENLRGFYVGKIGADFSEIVDFDENNKAEWTAYADGDYYVDATEYVNNSEPAKLKAHVVETKGKILETETKNAVVNPEFGKKYACEVTFGDGTKEMSDAFDYVYAITHQPTEAEPYVELNDDTDATYQWYTVECSKAEITQENASTVSYDWGESSYDEETGWIGVPYIEDYYGQDFFTVALEAGETVTVEVTGDFADGFGLWDYDTENDVWVNAEAGVTSYELTAEKDGNYTLYTYVNSGVVTVKATVTKTTYTKVEGQTSATLIPTELDEYACEVTFADGTKEMSDSFEVTHIHTFINYEETETPKCGVAGKEVASCENGCGATEEKEIPALTHKDDDGDYLCDHGCGHEFEKPVDPTPDTPDEPTDDACDHLCHKDGILGFLWKIIRFFQKLFGIQQYCDCGVTHW